MRCGDRYCKLDGPRHFSNFTASWKSGSQRNVSSFQYGDRHGRGSGGTRRETYDVGLARESHWTHRTRIGKNKIVILSEAQRSRSRNAAPRQRREAFNPVTVSEKPSQWDPSTHSM